MHSIDRRRLLAGCGGAVLAPWLSTRARGAGAGDALLAAGHAAAHRHPRPRAGARRRRLVHRPGERPPRLVRPEERAHRADSARHRLGAAWRHPRARTRPPGSPTAASARSSASAGPTAAVRAFPLPAGSPYANLNTATFDADGDLWFTGQSGVVGRVATKSGSRDGEGRAEGPRPLRHLHHARRRRLVVLARGLVHRPDRPQDRRVDGGRAADPRPGRAPRLERQPRPHLGQRMAERQPLGARSGGAQLAQVAPARRQPAALRGLGRRHATRSGSAISAAMRCSASIPGASASSASAFPRANANVRQIHGRPGEVWLPESGTEHISMIRTAT